MHPRDGCARGGPEVAESARAYSYYSIRTCMQRGYPPAVPFLAVPTLAVPVHVGVLQIITVSYVSECSRCFLVVVNALSVLSEVGFGSEGQSDAGKTTPKNQRAQAPQPTPL